MLKNLIDDQSNFQVIENINDKLRKLMLLLYYCRTGYSEKTGKKSLHRMPENVNVSGQAIIQSLLLYYLQALKYTNRKTES